jgi:hypothetical protein
MSAWYDGFTFEQVLSRLREAKKGEALSVPDGFGEWMSRRVLPDEPAHNQVEAELWRRLFEQLDRIEAGQGPRTLRSGQAVTFAARSQDPEDIARANLLTEVFRRYTQPDSGPVEPPCTWQSALRQLADTLIPGNTLQLDPSDPEAACATIVEAVQSHHYHEVQCALFNQLILRRDQVMSSGPAPYTPEDFLGSVLDELRINLFPDGRPLLP